MNYIFEINAFERWNETNYLPINSQLMWYKLIGLFNKCGWREWITVDNQRLMALLQISTEKTFVKARKNLLEAGLIEYQMGSKGKPSKYKLISFTKINNIVESTVNNAVESTVNNAVESTVNSAVESTVNSAVESTVNSAVESTVNSAVESTDIYKQNKTKQNKTSSSSALATVVKLSNSKSEEEEKILKVLETYKANINSLPSPIEVEYIRDWLNEVEPDVIILAVETAVLNNGRSLNYIKRIIDNWICQGLTTGEQVKAYLENWARNRNGAKDTKFKVICGNKQDEQQKEFLAKIEERKKRLMLDDDATM